jgi:mannose-6-phosphate isomerase-like protein (cupin superfamily)
MHDVTKRNRAIPVTNATTLDVFGALLSALSDGNKVLILVGEQTVPPGYGVPKHLHADDHELFYVLEGELIVSGPRGETKACAGACVELPRGIPHGFRNPTQAPARFHGRRAGLRPHHLHWPRRQWPGPTSPRS